MMMTEKRVGSERCETELGGEGGTGAALEAPRIREVHMEFVKYLRRREPSRIDTEAAADCRPTSRLPPARPFQCRPASDF